MAVFVCGVASQPALAQPLEQPLEEQTVARQFGRGGFGVGLNNRVSAEENAATLGDFGGTLNLEVDFGIRVQNVAFSWYSELTIREWGVIGDFYKRISKERGKEVVYGYLFGWLAGTDLIYSGPSVSLHTKPSGVAWFASVGMGPLILIDPRDPDAALGYGQMFGIGVGDEKIGIALRTIFSASGQHRDLAQPDPTYYNAFLSLYIKGKKKKHTKRRKTDVLTR